jgi:hypothetical protein
MQSEHYTLPLNKVCLDNCQKGNIVEEIQYRLKEHYIVVYAIESDDVKL